MLEILPVADDKRLNKLFVEFPSRHYKTDPNWVPPLRKGEACAFDPLQNPALEFCVVRRWVAMRGNKCVGRICAIVNKRWIKKTDQFIGRLNRFEVYNDPEAAHKLFVVAEAWLRKQEMTHVMGPLGFSNIDQQGLTIAGYNFMQTLTSTYTMNYYPQFFEHEGYKPMQDWYEYRITLPSKMPDNIITMAEKASSGIKVQQMRTLKDVKQVALEAMDLFDRCYDHLLGSYPLGEKLHRYYIKKYLSVVDPRYVFVAREENVTYGRIIGFLVAFPSVTPALRRARGRMFPFGWIDMHFTKNSTYQVETPLLVIDPLSRKNGILSKLIYTFLSQCYQDHIKVIETTAMLNSNVLTKTIMQEFSQNYERHKQKRCYIKRL